jgi:hypothetical protein
LQHPLRFAFGLALVAAAAIRFAGSQSAAPLVQSEARPILEFDKTRFVAGERVFFWIGLEMPRVEEPVPRELQDTFRIVLTRPDGTERVEKLSFPIDGPRFLNPDGSHDLGFKGGASLGSEIPQLGSWTAVVEFAGKRTQPVTFTVEDLPLLKNIEAAFVLSSPLILDSKETIATLTVHNRSTETIRFVEPGQNDFYISVSLTKTSGEAWGYSSFVPPEVLSAATGHRAVPMSVYKFTWAATKQFPTVTMRPGADFHLRLPVKKVIESMKAPAGDYDVRFWTELQLLVGEANGDWKDFAPIRLPVKSTTKGTKSQ